MRACCAKTVQTIWLMLNTCFPSWNLKCWQRILILPAPIKNLDTKSLVSSPGRQNFIPVVETHCWSTKVYYVWLRKGLLEDCSFFFVAFHCNSHKYDCMLSFECLPRELLNLGVGLGSQIQKTWQSPSRKPHISIPHSNCLKQMIKMKS